MASLQRNRLVAAALAAAIGVSSGLAAQQPPPGPVADFRVEIRGIVDADFHTLIWDYREWRQRLEVGLPPLVVTDNPAESQAAERALARRIRARRGRAPGAFFTPAITAEFKRALGAMMTPATIEAIMDDNPGSFSHRINGDYPKSRNVSTVPANVLALLPELPADIQYRFLGRTLVLHDLRANIIIDHIGCAFDCPAP